MRFAAGVLGFVAGLFAAAPVLSQQHIFATGADVQPYSPEVGSGFEEDVPGVPDGSAQGQTPFFFTQDVPQEGNYRITVTLGGPQASRTTVKAELRRLLVDQVEVPAGGSRDVAFIVNVRTPELAGGRAVRLKEPRETVEQAMAWDRRITLELSGDNAAVRQIRIEPVRVPTIYLLGDSTVTDQPAAPYASWGQMLTSLFQPVVAVANHSQSGESLSGALAALRVQKIMSLLQPGDMFVVQFGHNDQKQQRDNPSAHLEYRANLIEVLEAVKQKGAVPVVVTSMHRHRFEGGRVTDTLGPYPQMAREAANEAGTCVVDLHRTSQTIYEALGEEGSKALFKQEPDGSGLDRTHHSPYGAMQLAKAVALGLQQCHVPLAAALRPEFDFNPAQPDPASLFTIPEGGRYTSQRPLGD